MDVPATEPDEQELHPQRRQPQPHVVFELLLPLLVPPTEPVEPLLQVQVHVQRFELFELLVPPTEPELEFWQQGLQQELATKLGNTMPPYTPLLHIKNDLPKKCHGGFCLHDILWEAGSICVRIPQKNSAPYRSRLQCLPHRTPPRAPRAQSGRAARRARLAFCVSCSHLKTSL